MSDNLASTQAPRQLDFVRSWLRAVTVRVSVVSDHVHAACWTGVISGLHSGLGDAVSTGFQLRVLPLQPSVQHPFCNFPSDSAAVPLASLPTNRENSDHGTAS